MNDFLAMMNKGILEAVERHLKVMGDRIFFANFLALPNNQPYWALLSAILKLGHLPFDDLKPAVHKGICRHGKEMWEALRVYKYPDHVPSPEALSYALRCGVISDRNARRIEFDNGESLEEFKARSGKLLHEVLERLIAGPPPEKKVSNAERNNSSACCTEPHN